MLDNRNFILRFGVYLNERLQVGVLIFTTLAVVLSSFAVALSNASIIQDYLFEAGIAFITLVLFMFHIRVLDEYKDYHFDLKYHSTRPVQRGLISLRELLYMDILGLILMFSINVYFFPNSTFFILLALGYTIVTGNDFFLGKKIRKKFYLYNFLNMLQLLIFQFYLYHIVNPQFSFFELTLLLHFVFVLLNISFLEVARKIQPVSSQKRGMDTYSERLGVSRVASVFTFIFFSVYLLFFWMLNLIGYSPLIIFCSLIFLNLVLFSSLIYVLYNNKFSSLFLQGFSALFYISMHALLVIMKI